MARYDSSRPFVLSRSKLELSIDCPRCFFLDRKQGISRVSGPAFTLNAAVDTLLKHEFDEYRLSQKPHPVCVEAGLKLVPANHPELTRWRGEVVRYSGIQVTHKETGWIIDGLVDDVWQNESGELVVVDYKSTSKRSPVVFGSSQYHDAYKRQLEVYQWLLSMRGLPVSATAYILYANGKTSTGRFDQKLEFEMSLHPYQGDRSWVSDAIIEAQNLLNRDLPPEPSKQCEWCRYREKARHVEEPARLL